jgi:hypothetical protein
MNRYVAAFLDWMSPGGCNNTTINGFAIADELKSTSGHSLDLQIGTVYEFNDEQVVLERVTVDPSFKVIRHWFRADTVEPTVSVSVTLSKGKGTGSLLGETVFGCSLDDFAKGLRHYSRWKLRLSGHVTALRKPNSKSASAKGGQI